MRRVWGLSVVCVALLAILAASAGAAAPHKHPATSFKCPKGFERVKKTVRRHGVKKTAFHCRMLPVANPVPVAPVPVTPTTVTPAPAPAPAPVPAKLPSTTSLGVAYETLPPERTGITEFKIGQYKIAGGVAPFAIPSLVCGGLAGCLEPAGSLANGTLTVPVLARLERAKNLAPIWSVGVTPPVGKPSWIGLPELAAGTNFFQATGAPDPSVYAPSTARAPIQLVEPHLPNAASRHENESYGPVGEAFEEIILFNGPSYSNIGGVGYDIVVEGTETPSSNSAEGCKFQVRLSGIVPTGGKEWTEGFNETIFANVSPHTLHLEIWARHEGGVATCGLTDDDVYIVTERPHS